MVTYSSERCVQLAEQAHLTYTARLICEGKRRELIEVPTRDRTGTHIVCHVYQTGGLFCDCQATSPNCCHIGAAIKLLDQRAACYRAAVA